MGFNSGFKGLNVIKVNFFFSGLKGDIFLFSEGSLETC